MVMVSLSNIPPKNRGRCPSVKMNLRNFLKRTIDVEGPFLGLHKSHCGGDDDGITRAWAMPPMWRAGELVNLPKAGSSSLFCCSDLASSRASLSFLNWHVSSSQPSWPWWSSFLSWNRACLDPLLKVSTSLFVCFLFSTCLFVQIVHDFGLFVCFWNLA